MSNLFITTGQNTVPGLVAEALAFSEKWQIPFIDREKRSIEHLFEEAEAFIVLTKIGPVLHTPEGSHYFHLNLAHLRIKNLQNGKHDHMVDALGLSPGMQLLDCTLGLATDAIVASFILGDRGLVTGLESEKSLAVVTAYGLMNFQAEEDAVTAALRRIQVQETSYEKFLSEQPDQSFDVVYFDPMFRHPVVRSSQFIPLRTLANPAPIAVEALEEAKRIARKRVVVKETRNSREFERLGLPERAGGRYSRIQYGIWTRQVNL